MSEADLEAIEARWRYASETARKFGVVCTGAPGRPICSEPGALPIVLYRELFAVVCREHAEPVIGALASQGYAAGIRCERLDQLIHLRPDFLTGARVIRERNHRFGVVIQSRTGARPRQ
jgi:hypothetical protein